jgi:hypothetical protein
VRIFKTKEFARFARRQGLSDEAPCDAIDRAERGLIYADLGGNLIKQRVARPGQGRRGGYRTIIAYRRDARSLFVMGFAKSEWTTSMTMTWPAEGVGGTSAVLERRSG